MNDESEGNNQLLETVTRVIEYCHNCILDGITEYKKEKYYFRCIQLAVNYYWTDEYNLTLLSDAIISVILWNCEYCEKWESGGGIPHPKEYEEEREETTFKEMQKRYRNSDGLKEAEQYYKNNLVIEKYLKKNKPNYTLKGVFYVEGVQYNLTGIINESIENKKTKVRWVTP
jgi:hypothetical protein